MVKEILISQKRILEAKLQEKYVVRTARLKGVENDLIKVIIGPRRAGKSFFAVHVLNKIGVFGYANFDNEQLLKVKNYDEIVGAINSVYGNPKILLLDEIQNLPSWELFANRLREQGYNLVITGSNSKLLSKELATHLTGRHLPTIIFPFSFAEFIALDPRELTEVEKKEKLYQYALFGGYPEPILKKMDIDDYLTALFDSIIYKDIIKRYKIRLSSGIENLAFYLISNISKEYSIQNLTRVVNCKSNHTVKKYIGYLEEAFIFFHLDKFSFKAKEQISSNKKIYCYDTGFVHAKAFKTSQDIGRLYENVVAIELKRREMEGKIKFYWWKSVQQEEVDFIVKKGNSVVCLIQVCYDLGDPKTKDREIRALLKAKREIGCKELLVLTENYSAVEKVEWFGMKGEVKFMPIWKWLLEQ